MGERVRPYVFYDIAVSICATCYQRVEGKIVFQDGAPSKRIVGAKGKAALLEDLADYL